MTKIKEVLTYLEEIAPLHLQESYDNAGLIVGDPEGEISNVLICLDSTEEVIAEAVTLGCNLVVAHHPIVFSGLKQLTGATYIQRAILKAIKSDVAIYAIHTNLDNVLQNGVNQQIAKRLGLVDMEILAPKLDLAQDRSIGSGMMGKLPSPLIAQDFVQLVKDKMELSILKHTRFPDRTIKRVALCGGSGRFLLSKAIAHGADVFISSDFKYHEYFDANSQLAILDIGHYESERFTIDLLLGLLQKKFSTFAPYSTKVNTNPINYA